MNKIYLTVSTFIVVFLALAIANAPKNHHLIGNYQASPMPIIQDNDPYTSLIKCGPPEAHRGSEFRRYLAASVLITHDNVGGSGTIVYYDRTKNEAYVASCGHLWDGTGQSAAELQFRPLNCKIGVWYHNDVKLPKARTYNATVVFWNKTDGFDTSLLKFTPDWKPDYFPIAPLNYNLVAGNHMHSCGCDGGSEVARYDVEIVGYRKRNDQSMNPPVDLVTIRNSPRPGRSGGGLLSEDGYYVATCWGTSKPDGSGIGVFTPLRSIHQVYAKNGYGWLLNISKGWAHKLPIIDKNNPQNTYDSDYIKYPNNSISIPR